MPRQPGLPRRSLLRRLGAAAVGLQLLVGLGVGHYLDGHGNLAPALPGIALAADGSVVELGGSDRWVSGTRVLDSVGAQGRAVEQRTWLRAGTVPAIAGLDPELVRGALLDLHTLSRPYGVAVAGWAPAWRYVWPRDAAFVASALARTGHLGDARVTLDFLQSVPAPDGTFQARYAADGSAVPDRRGVQLDGTGWVLWGLGEVARTVPDGRARRDLVGR
ncbi:MAG: hypothetical protein ACLGIF_07115, partial [Actinomycetes bacterium]